MARPTKYYPEIVEIVFGLALQGKTRKEICKALRISDPTITKWGRKHPELIRALKIGRESPDAQVEASLFRQAIGYHYTEQVVTKEGIVIEIRRFQHPSVVAGIYWTKNRMPDRWRDKPEGGVQMPTGPLLQITMNDNRVASSPGTELKLAPGAVEVKQPEEVSNDS